MSSEVKTNGPQENVSCGETATGIVEVLCYKTLTFGDDCLYILCTNERELIESLIEELVSIFKEKSLVLRVDAIAIIFLKIYMIVDGPEIISDRTFEGVDNGHLAKRLREDRRKHVLEWISKDLPPVVQKLIYNGRYREIISLWMELSRLKSEGYGTHYLPNSFRDSPLGKFMVSGFSTTSLLMMTNDACSGYKGPKCKPKKLAMSQWVLEDRKQHPSLSSGDKTGLGLGMAEPPSDLDPGFLAIMKVRWEERAEK